MSRTLKRTGPPKHRKKIPIEIRFWSKVRKTENCWEWQAGIGIGGYGRFEMWRGDSFKAIFAHRLSWELKHGEIPKGLCVLHKCDNVICVNPDHLFLGTYTDNNKDRARKGRNRNQNGELNEKSKLKKSDVIDIIVRARLGENQRKIGNDYGVPKKYVSLLKNRGMWKHITEDEIKEHMRNQKCQC